MRRVLGVLAGILIGAAVAGTVEAEPFVRGHQLGVSVGTPAGLNLEYAHEFGKREVFLSGAHYGNELHGIHGGFTLERGDDARQYFAVNVVGGIFYLLDEAGDQVTKWGYGGFEGAFHYRAFFIAPAVTFGSGKLDDRPRDGAAILARLGFRWRL